MALCKHTCTHTHAATPANYATDSFFFTDTFLNLTGVFAVEGRSVVIHEANRGEYVSVVSCISGKQKTVESLSRFSFLAALTHCRWSYDRLCPPGG